MTAGPPVVAAADPGASREAAIGSPVGSPVASVDELIVLFKLPGVAETLDWGEALVALGCVDLDPGTVDATLGVLLKYQDDLARITGQPAQRLVEAARGAG
jgi:hypothetical protein